ncbi:aspartate aminotransferase [Fibrobacterales bacterium]|nr:aspartate aminotransferase [Fibrobacterales bacterium]
MLRFPKDRFGTNSLKWDKYKKEQNIIPLWVADMDCFSPPEVIDALHKRVEHGVFGYTKVPSELVEATIDHVKTHFNWEIKPEWILWFPGIVSGLQVAVRAVESEPLFTFTPIYPPFLSIAKEFGKNYILLPMRQSAVQVGGNELVKWHIDFDEFKRAIPKEGGHLLFCNPHNPVGRAFSSEELKELGRICTEKNVVVTSDEIHNGLILDRTKRHYCIAEHIPELTERTITLMAPSKTYNIPGISCSFAIIPNAELRRKFARVMHGIVPDVNLFGFTAGTAAFKYGEPWRQELLDYLWQNWLLVRETIGAIPQLTLTDLEATYLAWIDARRISDNPTQFFENAGVGLSNGADFGFPGYVRLNFACERELLREGLERIKNSIAPNKLTAKFAP